MTFAPLSKPPREVFGHKTTVYGRLSSEKLITTKFACFLQTFSKFCQNRRQNFVRIVFVGYREVWSPMTNFFKNWKRIDKCYLIGFRGSTRRFGFGLLCWTLQYDHHLRCWRANITLVIVSYGQVRDARLTTWKKESTRVDNFGRVDKSFFLPNVRGAINKSCFVNDSCEAASGMHKTAWSTKLSYAESVSSLQWKLEYRQPFCQMILSCYYRSNQKAIWSI